MIRDMHGRPICPSQSSLFDEKPERRCPACRALLIRRQSGNTYIETVSHFQQREYCNRECQQTGNQSARRRKLDERMPWPNEGLCFRSRTPLSEF
jgi:hypothetical protein